MKKALIVSGGWEGHDPIPTAERFEKILSENSFDVEVSFSLDSYADGEKLKTYDLIISHWTMGEIKKEYVSNVCNAVESGVGLAGCHGGLCDAFRNSTEWQFLTGSQWVAHPGNDKMTYRVNFKKSSDSEIIIGLSDFDITSEQYYIHVDPAVNVLATTRFVANDFPHCANGEVDVPVVYTKRWGKGKIFYTSLGHKAVVFDREDTRELMRRGFIWASK